MFRVLDYEPKMSSISSSLGGFSILGESLFFNFFQKFMRCQHFYFRKIEVFDISCYYTICTDFLCREILHCILKVFCTQGHRRFNYM